MNTMKMLYHNKWNPVMVLLGPTASEKTALAMKLHDFLPVDIISVDSALIYREMNIGTAKPSKKKLIHIRHRIINIRDPVEFYSAAEFRIDAIKEMQEITSMGSIPILVGGTIFYFKTLLKGLAPLPSADTYMHNNIKENEGKLFPKNLHNIDPVSALIIHPNDIKRIYRALEFFFLSGRSLTESRKISNKLLLPYHMYKFSLLPYHIKYLYHSIQYRFYKILSSNFESEVRALFTRGDLHNYFPSMRCVGYRQMWLYLSGKINYYEMVHYSILSTCKLAKSQITFLQSVPSFSLLKWEKNLYALITIIVQVLNENLLFN